jgi:hypothetical protein
VGELGQPVSERVLPREVHPECIRKLAAVAAATLAIVGLERDEKMREFVILPEVLNHADRLLDLSSGVCDWRRRAILAVRGTWTFSDDGLAISVV